MRVKVSGDVDLGRGMAALLSDPRVGYTVTSVLPEYEVILSRGQLGIDGEGSLLFDAALCAGELLKARVPVGKGSSRKLGVSVPHGSEEPVLRGVLRALMKAGRHGRSFWKR